MDIKQPDQDPSLSTGSRETGQQPNQDPSRSTGSLETGQQLEDDLMQNHPFTLEGSQGLPKIGSKSIANTLTTPRLPATLGLPFISLQ